MPLPIDDVRTWTDEALWRLHLLQAGTCGETPETRRGLLRDALAEMLAPVAPTQRAEYLKALDELVPDQAAVVCAPVQHEQGAAAPASARELVTDLCRRADALGEQEKRALSGMLQKAGFAVAEIDTSMVANGGAPDRAAEMDKMLHHLYPVLGLKRVELRRLVNLVILLVTRYVEMASVATRLWSALSPKSSVRISSQFEQKVKEYIEGSKDVPTPYMQVEIDKVSRVMASLVGAVGRLSSVLSKNYLAPFSPYAIRAAVEKDGGSMFQAAEVRCWKKFEELSVDLQADPFDQALKEALRRCMQDLVEKGAK